MQKIIFGLAGEMASGKGSVAKYLIKKYKGNAHRFSTMLRDLAKRMYLEESRDNLQKISKIFRQNFGEDILSKVIYQDVKNDRHKAVAVDGVRRAPDIKYLQTFPHFKLIYIETDLEKRFARTKARYENSDDEGKTFAEFKKDQKKEAELQIRGLKIKADFIVDNNGSFKNLYAQIDKIITKIKK
ncbi:AAA family ATPase [Patescibacteria group bacterium]|nr:AAA family ATPase [Patescibacteria group bacterium]